MSSTNRQQQGKQRSSRLKGNHLTPAASAAASAASPFQSIFDNVCRCFGHVPSSASPPSGRNGSGSSSPAAVAVSSGSSSSQQQQQSNSDGDRQKKPIDQVDSHPRYDRDRGCKSAAVTSLASSSSRENERRTKRLGLQQTEFDELFTEQGGGGGKTRNGSGGSRKKHHPPRPEQKQPSTRRGNSDVETAHAVAQAKLAANPLRYNSKSSQYHHSSSSLSATGGGGPASRSKRKRSPTQMRDDIFRNMNKDRNDGLGGSGQQQQQNNVASSSIAGNGNKNGRAGRGNGKAAGIPQPDFSRLLNPSLALCFATPIRGTEEEMEEQEAASDVKSLGSDTNTLNTNGDDTITSTLYFDSKYAHIQETRPPMPLFNQFKVGMESDEIHNIVATDSHSSMKMMTLLQEQQKQAVHQQQRRGAAVTSRGDGDDEMPDHDDNSTGSSDIEGDNDSSNDREGHRNINEDLATMSTCFDPRQQQQLNQHNVHSMSTIVQSNQRNGSGSDGQNKSHHQPQQHHLHGTSATAITTATTTSDGGCYDGDNDVQMHDVNAAPCASNSSDHNKSSSKIRMSSSSRVAAEYYNV